MAQTSVEDEIAKIRQQRADLDAKEDALLKKLKDQDLLKKANAKVFSRIVRILTDNGITKSQLLTALEEISWDAEGKVEITSGDLDGEVDSKVDRSVSNDADKRRTVLPKYANPSNPDEKWTGRGRSPIWAQKLKDAGTLEAALIPK